MAKIILDGRASGGRYFSRLGSKTMDTQGTLSASRLCLAILDSSWCIAGAGGAGGFLRLEAVQ